MPKLDKEEIKRLAGRPPLKTILFLIIGPLLSQLTGAFYGILNQIWISKKLGEKGMAAVAIEITLENIGRAFGYFMMIAGSTQISSLFGKNLASEASQVVCDILRCTIICGIIVPAILLPTHKPMCKWFGASDDTAQLGYRYLSPLCYGSVVTCLSLACQGFLQAEGRTLLIGAVDICALLIGCLALTPIFLYVFHMNVESAGISTIIVDGCSALIFLTMYFRGKFGIKPQFNQFLKPFSKHTWQSLVVGSSQLIANLAASVPGIPIRNLIGQSTEPGKAYDLAMDGFNVLCRFYLLVNAVLNANCTAFIAPASYAYARQNYRRFLKLSLHSAWIGFAWCAFMNIFSFGLPRQIAKLFGDGEEYLNIAEGMVRNCYALGSMAFFRFNAQAMLQAMQKGTSSMIVSMSCQLLSNLLFAYILFYTDKHNVVRLMWLYSWSHLFGVVIGTIFLIYPLWQVYQKAKIQTISENEEISDDTDITQQSEDNDSFQKSVETKQKDDEKPNDDEKANDHEQFSDNEHSSDNDQSSDNEKSSGDNDNDNEAKRLKEI